MASRQMRRAQGRSRLPPARVEWLGAVDSTLPSGTFTSAVRSFAFDLYDFGAATKTADNYGAGDWTIERMFFSAGVMKSQPALSNTLICVTFGIGLLNSATDVSDSTAAAAVLPLSDPSASWMVYLTCYINLADLTIQKCEVDVKARRRISPQSRLVLVAEADSLLPAGQNIDFLTTLRVLVRQRGSRV